MTQPVTQNLRLTRGDTTTWQLTFTQALSGFAEIWITIRESDAVAQTDDTDATAQLKLSSGGIVATGTYTADAEWSAAATGAFNRSAYVYDVQVRTLAGKIYTTQRGLIAVDGDVTRSTAAP